MEQKTGYRKLESCHTKSVKKEKNRRNSKMTEISVLDLQNLRHLISGFDTTHCKMQDYAHEAQDPQVKQFFQKSAQSALESKQQLMKFLQ